jgi:hypothetical protein
MRHIREYFAARYIGNMKVRCAALVEADRRGGQMTDAFDLLVLVITEHKEPTNYISHYIKEPYRIQERWIHKKGIEAWILNGENRNIIQWLFRGDILLDRDRYLEALRQRLHDFPSDLREKKLFMEFSYFLRKYIQSKEYSDNGHYLDAHSSILEALLHWARIVIIENGYHPEVTVWNQVRKIDPGVYKLYEELTQSNETLEQRVKLVQLACEFSVMSRMEECCRVLLRVLGSRERPWSASELKEHPELSELHVELALILKKLVGKSLIREVAVPLDDSMPLFELRYTVL